MINRLIFGSALVLVSLFLTKIGGIFFGLFVGAFLFVFITRNAFNEIR